MTLTQDLLDRIVAALGQKATNYTVFLRVYLLPTCSGARQAAECVREALGPSAVVSKTEAIGADAVVAEAMECLEFAGDAGAGPDAVVVTSQEMGRLLAEFRACLMATANSAQRIERVWIEEGHPAYPVFWDFAFLFRQRHGGTLVVGSSSD